MVTVIACAFIVTLCPSLTLPSPMPCQKILWYTAHLLLWLVCITRHKMQRVDWVDRGLTQNYDLLLADAFEKRIITSGWNAPTWIKLCSYMCIADQKAVSTFADQKAQRLGHATENSWAQRIMIQCYRNSCYRFTTVKFVVLCNVTRIFVFIVCGISAGDCSLNSSSFVMNMLNPNRVTLGCF